MNDATGIVCLFLGLGACLTTMLCFALWIDHKNRRLEHGEEATQEEEGAEEDGPRY